MVHFQKKIIVFFFFGTFPNRHLKLSLVIFGLVVISRMCFAAGNAKTRLDGPPRQPQQQRVQVEGFQQFAFHQNGTRLSNVPPFRVERGTVATAVSPSTRLVFSLAFEFLSECLSLSFCQCNCHYILLKLFILYTKMDSSFRIK